MGKSIGIFSKSKACGKSTTAVYLAESLATMGHSTLLVDTSFGSEILDRIKIIENQSENIKKVKLEGSLASWNLVNIKNSSSSLFPKFEYILFDLGADGRYLDQVESVIIPVEMEFYGLDDLKDTLEAIKSHKNVRIEGILLTKFESNATSIKVKSFLEETLPSTILNTVIARNYYLGLDYYKVDTITKTIPNFGYADYLKLANELMEKNGEN